MALELSVKFGSLTLARRLSYLSQERVRTMRKWLMRTMVLTAAWAGATPFPRAEEYSPRIGERHADFTLPSIGDGKPVSLSQFRGQKVLLIHFASW